MRAQREARHWREVSLSNTKKGEDEESYRLERGRGGALRELMGDGHPEISEHGHAAEGHDGSRTWMQ